MQKIKKIAVLSELGCLDGQAMIVRNIYEESKKEWSKFFDNDSGTHMVESVTYSNVKSDAINTFIAFITKLHLNAIGTFLRGFSKEFITSKNAEYIQLRGLLAGRPNVNCRVAYTFICVHMLGYDEEFVNLALDTDPGTEDRFDASIEFLTNRFDLDRDMIKYALDGKLKDTVVGKFNSDKEQLLINHIQNLSDEDSDPLVDFIESL